MDLKCLLLKAMSFEKAIEGCKRLYFHNVCFKINYQIKGKFLNITKIKKCLNKEARLRKTRIKSRLQLIGSYQRKVWENLKQKEWQDEINISVGDCPENSLNNKIKIITLSLTDTDLVVIEKAEQFDKEVQTFNKTRNAATETAANCKKVTFQSDTCSTASQTMKEKLHVTRNIATETSIRTKEASQTNDQNLCGIAKAPSDINRITMVNSSQQTISLIRYCLKPKTINISRKSQTDHATSTIEIQCMPSYAAACIQTDEISNKSYGTQTYEQENEFTLKYIQESISQDHYKALAYMLNEIGEVVLQQNSNSYKNSEMLMKIQDLIMSRNIILLRERRRKRMHCCKRKVIFYPRSGVTTHTSIEELKSHIKICKSIQTSTSENGLPKSFDKSSQTMPRKHRKYSFFTK